MINYTMAHFCEIIMGIVSTFTILTSTVTLMSQEGIIHMGCAFNWKIINATAVGYALTQSRS